MTPVFMSGFVFPRLRAIVTGELGGLRSLTIALLNFPFHALAHCSGNALGNFQRLRVDCLLQGINYCRVAIANSAAKERALGGAPGAKFVPCCDHRDWRSVIVFRIGKNPTETLLLFTFDCLTSRMNFRSLWPS